MLLTLKRSNKSILHTIQESYSNASVPWEILSG